MSRALSSRIYAHTHSIGTSINQAWNHVVGTLIDGEALTCWAKVTNNHQHTIHWKHVTSYNSIVHEPQNCEIDMLEN
jgi:hypothetical protein